MQRAGIALLVPGLLTMFGSAVGGGIFIYNSVKHTYTDAHFTYESKGPIAAEEGEDFYIHKQAGMLRDECSVTAPDGSPAEKVTVTSHDRIEYQDEQWVAFDRFRAGDAGNYTLDCPDKEVLVPGSYFRGYNEMFIGILVGVVGFGVGFLSLLGSTPLLITGVVNTRRERSQYQPYTPPNQLPAASA